MIEKTIARIEGIMVEKSEDKGDVIWDLKGGVDDVRAIMEILNKEVSKYEESL